MKNNINTISMHGEKFYQLHTETTTAAATFNIHEGPEYEKTCYATMLIPQGCTPSDCSGVSRMKRVKTRKLLGKIVLQHANGFKYLVIFSIFVVGGIYDSTELC